MFAKHKQGAACLADYRDIKKGGIVPQVNELYSQVKEWLESNEWAELPDDFGKQEPTTEQKISEIDAKLHAIDLLSLRPLRAIASGTGSEYDQNQLATLEQEASTLRAQRAELQD